MEMILLKLNGNLESGIIIGSGGVHKSEIKGNGTAALRIEPLKQGTHLYGNGVLHIY